MSARMMALPAPWRYLAPPALVALAFAITAVAGIVFSSVPAIVALNVHLFHLVNGLSCSVSPQSPIYQVMWTGFNNPIQNYIGLYGVTAAIVLLRHWRDWPKLLFVVALVAGLGYISNPIIWHWAWGPRPFAVTDACIKYPEWEPIWSSYSSYPSGHARETASEITVMLGFVPALLPLGLLYVGLLDFSRMYIGVHFPLDVLMGTLLGWAIGRIAFLSYDIYAAPLLVRLSHWRAARHHAMVTPPVAPGPAGGGQRRPGVTAETARRKEHSA